MNERTAEEKMADHLRDMAEVVAGRSTPTSIKTGTEWFFDFDHSMGLGVKSGHMNIGHAVVMLKARRRVQRAPWAEGGTFLSLLEEAPGVHRILVSRGAHASDTYYPTHADLLATDWAVLP